MVYRAAIRLRRSGLPLRRVRPRRAAFSVMRLISRLMASGRLAPDEDADRHRLAVGRVGNRPPLRPLGLAQPLEPPGQVEGLAMSGAQRQGVPADPHHEVGASLQHMVQPIALGVVAVAQPDLARRHLDPPQVLANARRRQLAIDAAADPRVVAAVQPPVRAVAAALADRRAVDQPDRPAACQPTAIQPPGQQIADQPLQPLRTTAQALEDRNIRQLAQTGHLGPCRRLAQRLPTRPVSQRKAQKVCRTLDLAPANQRSARLRRRFKLLCRAHPAHQILPTGIQL